MEQNTYGFIGLGLIGGSLAKALKRTDPSCRILAYTRTRATLEEALKAQAVCARTYAYQELSTYAYPDCEAHVDDSVSFQVYGNTGRTAGTDRAVAETAGQILTCQGSPITAYYFSTQPAIRRSGGTAIRQRHPIWPERPWTQPGKREI